MPCFHPQHGYRAAHGGFTLNKAKSPRGEPLTVPCGQCIGCRIAKARDWTTRLVHEASLHDGSTFATLTYSDEHLPPDYSLNIRDLQLFMKRLRKQHATQHTTPIRFFACGEYGTKTFRPHYHLILFGFYPPDMFPWRVTNSGHTSYRSPTLEKAWPFGFSELTTFNKANAAYVARYCIKKVNGDRAEAHYTRSHPFTGEIVSVRPEFIVMSRRPGIAGGWYDRFSRDCFPSDFVVVDGVKAPIPDFYTRKLDPEAKAAIKEARLKRAEDRAADNTPDRLAVRETSLALRVARLKRELD